MHLSNQKIETPQEPPQHFIFKSDILSVLLILIDVCCMKFFFLSDDNIWKMNVVVLQGIKMIRSGKKIIQFNMIMIIDIQNIAPFMLLVLQSAFSCASSAD